MSKKTAKHRVKMVVEIEFGYHDNEDFQDNIKRLLTKKELLSGLKRDLRVDGLVNFINGVAYNPKTKLKSVGFVKFDKQEELMSKSKLVSTQFMVTLVEYIGPDDDATSAAELEERVRDLVEDNQGSCIVHQVGKPKVIVEGVAS